MQCNGTADLSPSSLPKGTGKGDNCPQGNGVIALTGEVIALTDRVITLLTGLSPRFFHFSHFRSSPDCASMRAAAPPPRDGGPAPATTGAPPSAATISTFRMRERERSLVTRRDASATAAAATSDSAESAAESSSSPSPGHSATCREPIPPRPRGFGAEDPAGSASAADAIVSPHRPLSEDASQSPSAALAPATASLRRQESEHSSTGRSDDALVLIGAPLLRRHESAASLAEVLIGAAACSGRKYAAWVAAAAAGAALPRVLPKAARINRDATAESVSGRLGGGRGPSSDASSCRFRKASLQMRTLIPAGATDLSFSHAAVAELGVCMTSKAVASSCQRMAVTGSVGICRLSQSSSLSPLRRNAGMPEHTQMWAHSDILRVLVVAGQGGDWRVAGLAETSQLAAEMNDLTVVANLRFCAEATALLPARSSSLQEPGSYCVAMLSL